MNDDDNKAPPAGFERTANRDEDSAAEPEDSATSAQRDAEPDPGYSAFGEAPAEFDDPLADWPGEDDDRPLEALAEELAGSLETPTREHIAPPTLDSPPDQPSDRSLQEPDELPLPGRMNSLFEDEETLAPVPQQQHTRRRDPGTGRRSGRTPGGLGERCSAIGTYRGSA